jgi:hypothetical protein
MKKYLAKHAFFNVLTDTIFTVSSIIVSSNVGNENCDLLICNEDLSDKYLNFVLNGIKSLCGTLKLTSSLSSSTMTGNSSVNFNSTNNYNNTDNLNYNNALSPNEINFRTKNKNLTGKEPLNEVLNTNTTSSNLKHQLSSNTNNNAYLNNNLVSNNPSNNQHHNSLKNKLLNLGSEVQFHYIKKLISCVNLLITNLFNTSKTVRSSQFFSQININNSHVIMKERKRFLEIAKNLYEVLQEVRRICSFSLDLILVLLNLISSIKELLVKIGEESLVLKYIYLVISISWPEYDQEYYKLLSENYSIKIKKFSRIEALEIVSSLPSNNQLRMFVNLKYSFFCYLSDSLVFFLCQGLRQVNFFHISSNIMLNYNNKDKENLTTRKKLYLEILKWCFNFKGSELLVDQFNNDKLSMKGNNFNNFSCNNNEIFSSRDNLPHRLRYKLTESHLVYLLKHTVVSVHPINEKYFEVIIRNPITNITFSVEIDLECNITLQNSEECFKLLSEEMLNVTNNKRSTDFTNKEESTSKCSLKNSDKTLLSSNQEEKEKETKSKININRNKSKNSTSSKSFEENINEENKEKLNIYEADVETDMSFTMKETEFKIEPQNIITKKITINQDSKKYNNSNHSNHSSNSSNSNCKNFKKEIKQINTTEKNFNRSNSICYSLLNNVIFKQVISLLTEEDNLFSEVVTNKAQIQDYLHSLDNTSVYFLFNVSVIFFPNKSKIYKNKIIIFL